jgi:acetyl-CoA carboxylase biotin carboxyl carrier protein
MSNQKKQPKSVESESSSGSLLGLREIEVLLETLEKHEVTEFKLEREGEKVWLKRGPQASSVQMPMMMPPSYAQNFYPGAPVSHGTYQSQDESSSAVTTGGLSVIPGAADAAASASVLQAGKNIKEIRSPMVGTFYRRPAVDAEAYVTVGDSVKKGDVLCIVEAMKLMNEIESDIGGRVVEVCLEDGQMVEYGEVLFRIELI